MDRADDVDQTFLAVHMIKMDELIMIQSLQVFNADIGKICTVFTDWKSAAVNTDVLVALRILNGSLCNLIQNLLAVLLLFFAFCLVRLGMALQVICIVDKTVECIFRINRVLSDLNAFDVSLHFLNSLNDVTVCIFFDHCIQISLSWIRILMDFKILIAKDQIGVRVVHRKGTIAFKRSDIAEVLIGVVQLVSTGWRLITADTDIRRTGIHFTDCNAAVGMAVPAEGFRESKEVACISKSAQSVTERKRASQLCPGSASPF